MDGKSYVLVRLDERVFLSDTEHARRMRTVVEAIGSGKKTGRWVKLVELDGKQYFVDLEGVGTLEEIAQGMALLDGNALARFLALDEEKRNAEAKKLLSKEKWRLADGVLLVLIVLTTGFLWIKKV